MVQATSCETEKNASKRTLEGQMFHSRRNLKPTSTPHGMDLGRVQRVRPHAFTLPYVKAEIMESFKALDDKSRVMENIAIQY